MSITEKAMVLNLQIGIWKGHRLDREASAKIVREAGASGDAARVNKHIVPKDSLKDIETASNAVRQHFYEKTLPWKDNGDRVLTRTIYTSFIEQHELLVTEFKNAVDAFVTEGYPVARERASFRMGDLFDPTDYPSPESLRRKFYIAMDIDPVTAAGDFRVEMDAQQLDTVRKSMEDALAQRLNRAMHDVWGRVSKVVGHFATKMSSADAVFRDATVRNIEELVDLLPGLNLLDDPDLAAIAADLKAKLAGHDPKALRTDPAVRSQAAKDAQDIMDRMAPFMAAFGAGDDA